ncbi:MAG TPA: selenocysteine-specific translation elongation factor [Fimbriimonadaceae bacterium]|nr:selenocysteine-specific translation elongation factor [Fimbriimonadaceae bacterium]
MARLIGTAGHVDHGKTTLIQALTGIDADRLPEEKARGMTIDIGFAYVDLPKVGRASIVDVPGHERFITNMLVGALGIDVALLVVAADASVMPQTREHFQILELLPVEKLVVAMTRSDLVEEELRALVRTDIEALLASTRFAGSPIVEVSGITGMGIETLKEELSRALADPESAPKGPWYLPIDRVFTVKGHGCVVTGTLMQGQVKDGEKAILQPGQREVRIRSIQSHGDDATASEKGRRTALNLGGIKAEEVRRGMAVGAPGALFETRMLDAKVRWVAEVKHGLRVRISLGAEEAIGKIFLSEAEPDLVQVRLESSVACALGQPIIIRRYSPPDLLAGGRVAVPQASIRRKSESVTVVSSDLDVREAILAAVAGNSNGVPTEEICRRLGRSPQSLGDVIEELRQAKRLLGFGGLWFEPETFLAAANAFLEALLALHHEKPTLAYQPREKAVHRAGLKWVGKPLDRIIAALVASGKLRADGTGLRHPKFSVQLTDRQRAFLDRVIAALDAGGINAPSPYDLAATLHVPVQAVEEILRVGVEADELVRVAEGVFYSKTGLAQVQTAVLELGKQGPFTAAKFRDTTGSSRKYAIPLLEYFDSVRITVRVGDNRALVEK